MLMRRITRDAYEKMIAGAAVLARDDHGDKVLRLADGRGLKLFRRKSVVSSTWLWPYARRFAHASRCLAKRGITTVAVDAVFRVPAIERDVVVYRYLEGVTLRDAPGSSGTPGSPGTPGSSGTLKNPGKGGDHLMEGFARFLAELHGKGVYFRGIHFGNVLRLPDGRWGLIDVSEARFRPWPLWVRLRARNFKPLLRYPEDAAAIEAFGHARFLERYAHHARLTPRQVARLAARLTPLDRRFANPG